VFRYKTHIGIGRRFGFIRAAAVTSAVYADGLRLNNHIHHKRLKGKLGPRAPGQANAVKSAVRAQDRTRLRPPKKRFGLLRVKSRHTGIAAVRPENREYAKMM
jgi:hypothetical protein